MDFSLGEFGGSCHYGILGYDEVLGLKYTDDHGKGELGSGEFGGVVTDKVVSRLHEDPFCMDIKSTLEAAMICWFRGNQNDLVSDSGQSCRLDKSSLNWVWNDAAAMLQKQIGSIQINDFGEFGKALTDNVLSRLPDDPFCMNIKCSLKAAFPGWFHENQKDMTLESDKPIGSNETFFSSLNWLCDGTMTSQQQKGSITINNFIMPYGSSHSCEVNHSSVEFDVSNSEEAGSVVCGHDEPHDAFMLVLLYLRVEDLITVERVCKSLRDAVRNDPFLWKTIHVDFPLSQRVTDDSLLKLTHRAEGNLQHLILDGCLGITDDGLMLVLASNPHLTMLSVDGCTRLSTTGIVSNLRILKSSGILGLKSIRFGRGFYFTNEQFKELKFLLGTDANTRLKPKTSRFYGVCRSEICLDDSRVIDIEICPRCQKPGLLYNCLTETCQLKDQSSPVLSCRACIICVERCIGCGRCVNHCEYEELFCLDLLCFVCCKKMISQLVKVETEVVSMASSTSGSTTSSHPELARYRLCFYG